MYFVLFQRGVNRVKQYLTIFEDRLSTDRSAPSPSPKGQDQNLRYSDPRFVLSEYIPIVTRELRAMILGTRGSMVNSIEKQTNCRLQMDDGGVKIIARNEHDFHAGIQKVKTLLAEFKPCQKHFFIPNKQARNSICNSKNIIRDETNCTLKFDEKGVKVSASTKGDLELGIGRVNFIISKHQGGQNVNDASQNTNINQHTILQNHNLQYASQTV